MRLSQARFEINGSYRRSYSKSMKLNLVGSIAVAILVSATAFSQSQNPASALPSAPGAAAEAAPAGNPNATKIVALNVEGAILATNEAQREMAVLQKKFEPKMAELKTKSDEIDALKKKIAATTTTQAEKDDLNRQVELKQKVFDRDRQDVQEDAQGQQAEVGQRIFQKMAPVIRKYAEENSVGMIIDTSAPWPQGPVLWANPASIDITKAVIEAYNVQSGVPAPAAGSTAKPPATRPSAPATKPATPPAK